MNRVVIALFSAASVVGFAACAGSPTATDALSERTVSVDGRERRYLLYAPANAQSELRPLVLVFHGGGGTAKGISREVGDSLHRIADRERFFVAYPDAVDKIWDFGAGKVSKSLKVRIDDRSFFEALLDVLVAALPIDERRIFATGISRGGQASYFVACEFPDRIRAIAPVAMPMPQHMFQSCSGVSGIGVAVLNGTDDPLVPYDGGTITVGLRKREDVLSTDDTIEFWRSRNGCSPEPTDRALIDTDNDRMQVRRTRWTQCELDPVVLYRIEGGGHTWPSGRQYLPRFMVGPVNRDIDGATEIWAFFSQFR